MMNTQQTLKNAWSVTRGNDSFSYGQLPKEAIYQWATEQADLSERYFNGDLPGVSATPEGKKRKEQMLYAVRQALVERSSFNADTVEVRMKEAEKHLEDPGLLKNFEFFEIPSSDFMLQFYFAVWDRRIAELMGYLHNYGKDLKGVVREVPPNDVWYQMSYFEGMNINERKKSQAISDFITSKNIKYATTFGGGNIPERFYSLPKDLELTVFDDGPVSPMEELFPDENVRKNVHYCREPLSKAMQHQDLFNTQELVWMHGVSMYLNEVERHEMTGAILAGLTLLRSGGYMKYDYLLWTESMRRVIKTQNWPYDPRNPMVIFDTVSDAIIQGRITLQVVSTKLAGIADIETLDPEVTLVEPWGTTSVRFTIRKHSV
ncbi:hypothetical protein IJI18_00505 [Candidatus Saccharibacteria bacterium]|nr:hypothetical protein [Candidatus Saccharibacteria bacterium]